VLKIVLIGRSLFVLVAHVCAHPTLPVAHACHKSVVPFLDEILPSSSIRTFCDPLVSHVPDITDGSKSAAILVLYPLGVKLRLYFSHAIVSKD